MNSDHRDFYLRIALALSACQLVEQELKEFRGQCGLARPRVLAGGNPAWVIVSREPSIEPCGACGNRRVDV